MEPAVGTVQPVELARNDFWVVGICSCGNAMAMREGATWPACPRCGGSIKPPMPDMAGTTLRTRGNGRKGLCSPIYEEQEALALARGWPAPDLDAVVPSFVDQQASSAPADAPRFSTFARRATRHATNLQVKDPGLFVEHDIALVSRTGELVQVESVNATTGVLTARRGLGGDPYPIRKGDEVLIIGSSREAHQ